MRKKINIFSFFSGAGFLDLGFDLEGHYRTVYVSEYHKPFNDIYQHSREVLNIPKPRYGNHIENILDIVDDKNISRIKKLVDKSKAQTITGIIGGPPCPDFSIAGKQKGSKGDNGKLTQTYTDLVCKLQPDFFLFENVKGLYRTSKHRKFFEKIKRQFRGAGYILTEQLVNALEFGAPQDRDRILLVGMRQDFLVAHRLPKKGKQLVFDWEKNKSYHMDDVMSRPWPTTNPYHQGLAIPMPDSIIPELTVQHWWEQNDVENHPNSNMYFQPRAGIRRFQTVEEGDDSKKCYKRLHRWRYSPTAAYGNNEVHIHPYLPRRISVAEALAIQSLPRGFELPQDVTLTDAFKTIGNGVPFKLALGVAKNIYDYLNTR